MSRKRDEPECTEHGCPRSQCAATHDNPRDEARRRAAAGLPLRNRSDVVFALLEIQATRTTERTPLWYFLNRIIRISMDDRLIKDD
jgi:hypothetical protein